MRITLEGDQYDVTFRTRQVTQAVVRYKGKIVAQGEAVCHPNDEFDALAGRREAFERVVEKLPEIGAKISARGQFSINEVIQRQKEERKRKATQTAMMQRLGVLRAVARSIRDQEVERRINFGLQYGMGYARLFGLLSPSRPRSA